MDLLVCWLSSAFLLNLFFLLPITQGATFTFVNKCEYTVWPGILANAGTAPLGSTGFELPSDASRSFLAPTGWSGRFWGRTGCDFVTSSTGVCSTGDCGSGKAECDGAGASPPATLAEFTLSSGGAGQDFYDVSLVDGYNLPMLVEPASGSGTQCVPTGCVTDVNRLCPNELRVGDGVACKSACLAFETPKYCCNGAYGSPDTCKPTVYSQVFKTACPRSYSYAYDDPTSTFTCNAGADYTITFCPASSPSQKATTPVTTTPTIPPPVPVTTTPTIPPPVPVPVTTPPTTIPPPVTVTTTPPTGESSGPYDSQYPFGGGSMNYDAGSTTGTSSSGGNTGAGGGEFGSSTTGQDGTTTTTTPATTTDSSAGSQSAAAAMADGSWVTNMAMGQGSSSAVGEINPTCTSLLLLVAAAGAHLCLILPLQLLF